MGRAIQNVQTVVSYSIEPSVITSVSPISPYSSCACMFPLRHITCLYGYLRSAVGLFLSRD